MSELDYTFRPAETYFYARLDVQPNADQSEMEKAGKLAFKRYAESDREQFLPLREAREALTDETSREAYDQFCDELGVETGTKAYSKWESRGSDGQQVAVFLREFGEEDDETDEKEVESTQEGTPWERINIDNPVISWADGKVRGAMNTNLWTDRGKRLYINNFYPEGDIYLDLETGQFYTESYDRVDDVEYTVSEARDTMHVHHQDVQMKLDLSGDDDSNTLEEHLRIGKPAIKTSNFDHGGALNVSIWEDSRIYVNGFHPSGAIYIWLETGTVHQQRGKTEPIGDVSYGVSQDGTVLTLTKNDREVVIDLLGESDDRTQEETREEDGHDTDEGKEDTDPDEGMAVEMSDVHPLDRPGVWIRMNVHPVLQVVLFIAILAAADAVVSPQSVLLSAGVLFISSIVLYVGGLLGMALGAGSALLAGRFPLSGFYAAVGAVVFLYYRRVTAAMEG